MNTPLYYQGVVLKDEDFSDLSETFKLPYDVVAEVIAQIKRKGEPLYAQYTGTTRERIRTMFQELSFEPPATGEENTDPAPKTESDEVVDHASTALMQAITNTGGFFLITDDGICTVNTENPPDLTNSYQAVANVLKLRDLGNVVDDKSSWMLGSIVDELEKFHGENVFSVSQVCDETTKSYNTIITAVGTYRKFKNKRYNLSFTHHKEAFYQKVPDEVMHLLLHKAEAYELSAKNIRALASVYKVMEDDQVLRNIRSAQQAHDLIAAHKSAKVLYIVFRDREWLRITGLAGEPPKGQVVINTKEWTATPENGDPVEIKKSSSKS